MEALSALQAKKGSLTVQDACVILQFLQNHTGPLLSLRAASADSSSDVRIKVSKPGVSATRSKIWLKKDMEEPKVDADLNLASLDEFPPVAAAVVQQKHTEKNVKPKRRIAPTPMHPQKSTTESSVFVSSSVWKEPSGHHAFSDPHLEVTSDLEKALDEDRRQIQQEIASQRHKHAARRKKKGRNVQLSDLNSEAAKERFQEKNVSIQSVRSGNIRAASPECFPDGESGVRVQPAVPSAVTGGESQNTSVSNPTLLDEIAALYLEIIKGLLVPNVVSEIYFLLQLLTVTISPSSLQKLQKTTSSVVFKTVEDCVYFSLSVMDQVKELFVHLDKSTLQLLANNSRVVRLKPVLKTFFDSQLLLKVDTQEPVLDHRTGRVGVQFLEDTDSSKNFPDMKAFHAFKKQRDGFYAVWREWEKHCHDPKWKFGDQLGEKINAIVRSYGEVCSHAYFAKLFLRQLIESCTGQPAENDMVHSSLKDGLSKVDQERLMKLAQRFYTPSSGHTPCPPPSFTTIEEFFIDFITIADSYLFNSHLVHAIVEEISQFCTSIQSGLKSGQNFAIILRTLRILGKFLGYLDFLPYTRPYLGSSSARTLSMDLVQCVREAVSSGRLCLTVPWVVQYMSMMDPQAVKVDQYRDLLTWLMEIYRALSSSNCSGTWYFLVCYLGWLFEIPNFPPEFFLQQSFQHGSKSSVVYRADSLDAQELVTTELLYLFCPFLNGIHSLLLEFEAGIQSKSNSKRKIKPLTTVVEGEGSGTTDGIQQQLISSFFHNHSPDIKAACEFTSERVSKLAIRHIEDHILAKHIRSASFQCAAWFLARLPEMSALAEGEQLPQVEGGSFLWTLILDTERALNAEIQDYVYSFCHSQSKKAIGIFLEDDKVASTVIDITTQWSVKTCLKHAKLASNAKLEEEVIKVFSRGQSWLMSQFQSLRDKLETVSLKCDPKDLLTTLKNTSMKIPEDGNCEGVQHTLLLVMAVVKNWATVVPSIILPSQEVCSIVEDYLCLSMDLTVHLVSQAAFADNGEMDLLETLISGWTLCKGLKVEVPADKLLCAAAFEKYLKTEREKKVGVWKSLAVVLNLLVSNSIVFSPLVEGLWLCRWHQHKCSEVCQAIFVFLSHWHFSSDDIPVHFVRLHKMVLTED